MGAEYVEISLEEMDRFLKRAYRVLRPKRGVGRGIYYYDLHLSENVGVRVRTSISARRDRGMEAGEGAIRVGLFNFKADRPIKDYGGKLPIVKRTAGGKKNPRGWKTNLQNRIDEEIESYDEREDYWEQLAGGDPDRITDRQFGLIKRLVGKLKRQFDWKDDNFDKLARDLKLGTNPNEYTKTEASNFIEAIKGKIEDAEKAEAESKPTPQEYSRPPGGEATFSWIRKLDTWGVKGFGLEEGDSITAVTKAGKRVPITVGPVVWEFDDGNVLCEIDRSSRRYAFQILAGEAVPGDDDYDRT
jgi:hypothetical protein